MNWLEIRQSYPEQWLLIEALQAHTDNTQQRHLDQIAVLEQCSNGMDAMNKYRELHKCYPQRELYFVHTGREDLQIEEKRWFGVRMT